MRYAVNGVPLRYTYSIFYNYPYLGASSKSNKIFCRKNGNFTGVYTPVLFPGGYPCYKNSSKLWKGVIIWKMN